MFGSITRTTCLTRRVATHRVSNQVRSVGSTSTQGKKEGDISSVFTSLSGGDARPLDPRFAELKKRLIKGNEKALEASWRRLLRRIAKENHLIAQKGPAIIPQIEFIDLASRPKDFENEVRLRGVAVVKGVVPAEEARAYKSEVEEYVRANPWTKAFPQHAPAVFELYWSQAQVKARAHPNLIATQRYLMSLWHSDDPSAMVSTAHPVSYADRVRIRQPGDAGFALGPHVDGGSVERWEEEGYGRGKVYKKIFDGQWEAYDPWETSCRLPAVMDLYNSAGGCSMYRMFQGWLSMSHTGPNEGTLMVNPLLQLSTAYFMLRPFFQPIKQPNVETVGERDPEFLNEENWILEPETSSLIQGAGPGVSQEMNDILHPHLELSKTMVHIPQIQPGDFVVWHCDSIHAVDKVHMGKSDSSVLYIPVCPLTQTNLTYLTQQRETFLSGYPGPDFPGGKGESEHRGRPSVQFMQRKLGLEGLRAMGFAAFDNSATQAGESEMISAANQALGFA